VAEHVDRRGEVRADHRHDGPDAGAVAPLGPTVVDVVETPGSRRSRFR
jgi:hypothetical protein